MKNGDKTKEQLIKELQEFRRLAADMEKAAIDCRRTAEELERIFNLVPDMIAVASADGYFKKLNPAWEKTLGFTVEELLRKPFADLIHPDDVELTMEEVKRQIDGEATVNFVNRYRCRNGSYRWLEWVATPAKNKTQLFAVARDITERKQIEEALRESEERFRIIFSSAADGLVLTDVGTRKFHSCNKMFSDMLGYGEEEIKNLSVMDIHPEEDLPYIIEQFCKLATRETTVNNNIPVKRKDGGIFYADIHAVPITLSGKTYLVGIFRDITEHKRAEGILHRSEERFRALIENTSDWIWEVDRSFAFTYSSPKVRDLLGYEPAEVIGKTPFDFMPEHEAKRVSELARAYLASHSPFTSLENMNRHKDGRTVIIETSGIPVFDKDGNFAGYRGIDRDITKRKLAEEALKESEWRLRTLSDNLHHGLVYQIDSGEDGMQRQFLYISAGVERLHGVTVNEALNDAMSIYDQIIPEDRVRLADEEAYAVANMVPFRTEARLRLPSGQVRWRLFTSAPRRLENRRLVWDGIEIDITERKRAEEAVHISEEKYRLVFENANDAILIVQNGMIKFPNRQAISLSGYTEEELTSVPFFDFVHTDDKDMVLKTYLKRLQRQEVPPSYFFRIITKSGEIRWVDASAVLVNWEGRPATLSFLRDITAQKKLEEQLFHARKMEAIGTLAGGIAHDFNNLLMGILGYTSLMLMKTDKGHPHYERLTTIKMLVESGADLTRQLLGFARGGKYQVRPINVNELITSTSEMFGRTKKEITILRNLREDLFTIEADKGQIEQVLMNLYVNAWQAMPSGGTLSIKTENVSLDELQAAAYEVPSGRFAKITLTDTGVGMDADTQKRIFEPFFSTKGFGKGTGLGLASAYGIIRNHGGLIDVRSAKGRGTTFDIYLPASEEEPAKVSTLENGLVTGRETILIVDDEKINLETVKELLDEIGYRTLTAQSGREAIEIYRQRSGEIQLVILDVIMPEMNGKETFLRLAEIDKDVRVLLSSGYSINGEAKTILELGCKGFLQKPFRIDELSRKIREVLDTPPD